MEATMDRLSPFIVGFSSPSKVVQSFLEGDSSKAAGDVLFAAILFAIGQLPYTIFHLTFSMENEK